MGPSPTWRASRDSTLHWRTWDDEFVVYHENSGDTHRLSTLGAAALRLLAAGPVSESELLEQLATSGFPARKADGPDHDIQDLTVLVADLLARLSDLGLIEPASPPDTPHDA